MRKALHPYVVAGVAVLGASTLAITPIIAAPPDIKIVNPEVRPTASVLDVYRDAVEHVLANLEALLGSTLAGPQPSGLDIELVLDGVFGDPGPNFQSLRDSLDRNVDDLPVLLESVRTRVSDALDAALVELAAGRFDVAVGRLLSASVYAVVQVVDLATAPARPLPGDLGEPVEQLRSQLTVALLGPVVNGVGTTAQGIQGLVAALESGEPDRALNAVVTAPALITDRVLNGGYTSPAGSVLGEQMWPGVLGGTVPLPATSARIVTLEVNAGVSPSVGQETRHIEDPNDVRDADEGTNKDVMATDAALEAPADSGPGSRPFGLNSTGRTGDRRGLNTLRDGIRDGIEGFRDGIRKVVRTVAGRGEGRDDGTTGGVAESP